jgi:hypothetical protein
MDALDFLPFVNDATPHKCLGVDGPDIGAEFAPLLAEQFRRWVVANCADFEREHGQLPSKISIEMDISVE